MLALIDLHPSVRRWAVVGVEFCELERCLRSVEQITPTPTMSDPSAEIIQPDVDISTLDHSKPTPVTVLTGFLGAGECTSWPVELWGETTELTSVWSRRKDVVDPRTPQAAQARLQGGSPQKRVRRHRGRSHS
jgi:hypothetical protein